MWLICLTKMGVYSVTEIVVWVYTVSLTVKVSVYDQVNPHFMLKRFVEARHQTGWTCPFHGESIQTQNWDAYNLTTIIFVCLAYR